MNRSLTVKLLSGLAALGIAIPWAAAAPQNLAPLGTAISSTQDATATPDKANDGNRDGNLANGSVFRTDGLAGPGEFWEVDLGAEYFLDRILVFPRVDVKVNSVRDIRIEVFDSGGATTYTGDFLSAASTFDVPWGTAAVTGVQGQRVRLTLKDPNASATPAILEFAEVEVWGDSLPLPVNMAGDATISSSSPGFGSTTENGTDGDLAGDYGANSEADGPMFHDTPAAGQGFFRMEFPENRSIDEVQIYNRVAPTAGPGLAAQTTSRYRVSLLAADGRVVTSRTANAAGQNYDHILDFGGAVGRTVLLEEFNPAEFLAFSEVRVFGNISTVPEPAVMNLATLGSAMSKTSRTDCAPGYANDGNRDGRYGLATVFHSVGTQDGNPDSPGVAAGEWWEVDLGGEYYIDRLLIFPRTDVQQNSLRDFTIEIFDAAGDLVWSESYLPENTTFDDPWGTARMSGARGQRVRLTLTDPNFSDAPNFITFSEVEVWGSSDPVPLNIAPSAVVTSSPGGFGASILNGIDGDLAANFYSVSETDGPVFHDAVNGDQGFYKLDFGKETVFGEVQLYNRVVNNEATTTAEYLVSVLDAEDAVVASRNVTAQGTNYDHILDFGGATGRSLLIEEGITSQFLAFSEIRVMAATVPPVVNEIRISSIERNALSGELTIQALLEPGVIYLFERSSDLVSWIDIQEDYSTPGGNAEVTYTPPVGIPAQYYRFRKNEEAN